MLIFFLFVGRTNLLHRATKEGNYIVVSELVKSGYKLEAKNQNGQTAVHLASQVGQDDILKKLIDNGANVNCRDTLGNTPLHYACQNNHKSTIQLLVRMGGGNIQARNTETGRVPLHDAAAHGHMEAVATLLSLNAPVMPRTSDNELPYELSERNNHIACMNLLINYRSPPAKTYKGLWYHGTLDRHEAQHLMLKTNMLDGTYLVRLSDRNNGCNVLTMVHEGQVYNFLIRKEVRERFFIKM